ncbi:MAG: isopeptide-forming domain-containing fimbrial protein, partial [Lachnospiraceae bacterium]|nr:isopeptide-forming domain-containing fimbrial protein [Lachnospiraceae bacterium]
MKKRSFLKTKFVRMLVALCLMCVCAPAVTSQAKDVSLKRGEKVYYEGYSTFYYYIDGTLGYCLEPAKSSPHDGKYMSKQLSNSTLLSKTLYYAYGNPGYQKYLKPVFGEEWQTKKKAYSLSHCILSYVYDGCKDSSDAFTGLSPKMKKKVISCTAKIKTFPAVPDPDITFSKKTLTAVYDKSKKVQKTSVITCKGDPGNAITLKLPADVTLVNETKKTSKKGNVAVNGGDRFYLKCPVDKWNGKTWKTGNIYGKNRQNWRCLVINTGAGGQHLGVGQLVSANILPTSLQVTWIKKPKLKVEKSADREDKKYKVGEIIHYTVDVTQQIEKAVAKNIVITDRIITEGVRLIPDSIILYDKNQNVVSDAILSVKDNTYTINTKRFLESYHTGEHYTVTYEVEILDEKLMGREIENEVVVRSDNTEEVRDKEIVEVEEPEEP